MTPKEKFCLLAGFFKKDLFKDGCDLFNPKTNERAVPKQLVTDIIYALDQCEVQEKLITKQKKILDVVKNKEVDLDLLGMCKVVNDYNTTYDYNYQLTQEEYDLLKGWLNDN